MPKITERTDRFEMIAATPAAELVELADTVLRTEPEFEVRQEPTTQLVLERAIEPVERRPFNVGEVVVTAAEVIVDSEPGFAMLPGRTSRGAIAGAVVDAAFAAGHPQSDRITSVLEAAADRRASQREKRRKERAATSIEFESIEDEL